MTDEVFLHMLLYECPQCGFPVWARIWSGESNLEEIDARELEVKCKCRWRGRFLGVSAKRHLVDRQNKPLYEHATAESWGRSDL
jgi:hypothetical protein